MSSLVGGDESISETGPVGGTANSPLTEKQAERAWKLAELRMKMMEADYAACIAAEKQQENNFTVNSESVNEQEDRESPTANGYAQLDGDVPDGESYEALAEDDDSEIFGEFQFAQFPEGERTFKTASNDEIMSVMKSMKWRPKRDRVLRP